MKKFILKEEQIKHIIKEELGIAKEVINLTKEIENNLILLMSKGIKEKIFNVKTELSEVIVDYLFVHFNNIDEYYNWYNEARRNNGYSFKENTIYITIIQISNYINIEDLIDTIQHECSHYWECRMKGKNISTDKYQEILIGMENRNPIVSTICEMLYYSNKNEINSYVNGTYASAMKKKKQYKSYKEFIEDNQINDIYTILKNANNTLSKYDSHNVLFITGILYLTSHKIVINYKNTDDVINYLKRIVNNAYKYLIKKIGMVYSLYCLKLEEEQEKLYNLRMKEILRKNGLRGT